jgi:hypothetical protein
MPHRQWVHLFYILTALAKEKGWGGWAVPLADYTIVKAVLYGKLGHAKVM